MLFHYIGLPGTVIYSDLQNLTNCACSGQKGDKGQDGSVIFVNDTTNVAKGEKGERGARGKKGKQGPMVILIAVSTFYGYTNKPFLIRVHLEGQLKATSEFQAIR